VQVLAGSKLALYFGERRIFSDVSVEVQSDSRIGIVGPNGSGKTSLLRVLLQDLEPDEGTIDARRGIRLGYVPQVVETATDGTLRDVISGAFSELEYLERALSRASDLEDDDPRYRNEVEIKERYESLLAMYQSLGGSDHAHLIDQMALQVGLGPSTWSTPAVLASGGERTRAGLARALLTDPDLLILDEPTNYLDFSALDWLEGFLTKTKRAFIVVSHDRFFLDRVTRETWEMSNTRLVIYPGAYSRYRALKAESEERQRREYEKQEAFVTKEREYIERNRAGQNARQARGRETRLARVEVIDAPGVDRTVRLARVLRIPRSGDVVLTVKGLHVGVTEDDGGIKPLLEVPDINLRRGSRTCIIGPNGSGKTTLLQTLLGFQPPLAGSVSLGEQVRTAYLRQDLGDLADDPTVTEAILEVRHLPHEDLRGYLARFLFFQDDLFKRISALSGGERSRLSIARLLLTAPNLLVLDEPTTHLDIPSREAVEEVLQGYEGTLLFVSHDRRFINSIAEQLWIAQGESLTVFEGRFEDWNQSSNARINEPTAAPRVPASTNRKELRRQRAAATRPDGLEKTISMLEGQLAGITTLLEVASSSADVEAITRLGNQYERIQAELERTMAEWAG
jgi:ATP-binding cassette subfamily F protein 3